MILQFIDGLHGNLQVTFEEGTSAAWLYDLLKPHITKLVVCDPRKNTPCGKAARGRAEFYYQQLHALRAVR